MKLKKTKLTVESVVTVILAAGKGKRMNNPDMPKVLFEVNGKSMIDYVVRLALRLNSLKTILVVRHQRDAVVEHVTDQFGDRVSFVEQREQLGTGHAVLQTEKVLEGFEGDVLLLSGDVPLLREQTVRKLLVDHQTTHAVATILTAEASTPMGYGRILRHADGSVERIVEERDATEFERQVTEINSGIYVFKKVELFHALKGLQPTNAQHEYYLTGVFECFWREKLPVLAVKARDFKEVHGINTSDDLNEAQELVMAHSSRRSRG